MVDNEPLLDAILYDWYPHALPGELDELDLLRFWRMIEAKSIMAAEDERQRLFDGAPQPTKIDGDRWRRYQRQMKMVAEHDQLLDEANG